MTQYKSIREWIAEGVNPVGYVSKTELVVESIYFECTNVTATVVDGGMSFQKDLSLIVAPPAPKRLSDEELLEDLLFKHVNIYRASDNPTVNATRVQRIAKEAGELRSQILERMKQKGPTRGEVAKGCARLLRAHNRFVDGTISPSEWAEEQKTFLSMFPEADQ